MKRRLKTLNIEVPVYEDESHDPVYKNVIVVYQDSGTSKANTVLRVVDIADPEGKDLLPFLRLDAVVQISQEVTKEVRRRLVYELYQNLAEVA